MKTQVTDNSDGTQTLHFDRADQPADLNPQREKRRGLLRSVDADDVKRAKAQMEAEAAHHWPSPEEPTKVARKLIERKAFNGGSPLFWQDDWMTWTGSHWTRVDEKVLSSNLRKILEHGKYLKTKTKDNVVEQVEMPWPLKIAPLREVRVALQEVSTVDSTAVPAWVREDGTVVADHPLGAPGDWIAFGNGLFNWRDRRFVPSSREFFNQSSLPYSYDPDAAEPSLWLRCLDQWFPGDAEAIQLLQEWFGYVLSGRLDLEAALYVQGVPGSGKTTVRKVLEKLVGSANVVSMSTNELNNDNFGLEKTIGKSLIVFPEAEFRRNAAASVEKFKSIASGEPESVRRKNKTDWEGVLPGRMMFTSNHAPHFPDNSGAPLDRLYALAMNQKFRGTEAMRSTLDRDLEGELSGILSWALDGLDRLNARGRFVQPGGSHAEVLIEAAELGSPLGLFVAECCDVGVGKDVGVLRGHTYARYSGWCDDNGHKRLASNKFGSELKSYMESTHPGLWEKKEKGIDRKPTDYGIALRDPEPRAPTFKPRT
ncbi:DNA primase family protein [Rhodococcus ruber]|uniref:DNA primase family protein n=1 Tax=Rhodococcus ruber TaxID=1830 RepID=UPI000FF0B3F0|nr:phage/plasmid primase, P4 family [Rhodococcus ruber]RQM32277.1 hypothetical protein TN91_21440 [Rhodococcus ruber]